MLLCKHKQSAACTQPGRESATAGHTAAHIHDHHSRGGGVGQQLAAKQRRGAAVGLGGRPRQVGQAVQRRNLLLHGGGGLGVGAACTGEAGSAAGGRWAAGRRWGCRAGLGGRPGTGCDPKDTRWIRDCRDGLGAPPAALTASEGQQWGPGMPASGPDRGAKARRVIGGAPLGVAPKAPSDGPCGTHLSRAALCTKTTQSPPHQQRWELRGSRCNATMSWVLCWARA